MFGISTLFAPQFTCFFVGPDNNKDNNFLTLLPNLEIFVKNTWPLYGKLPTVPKKINKPINGITSRVTSPELYLKIVNVKTVNYLAIVATIRLPLYYPPGFKIIQEKQSKSALIFYKNVSILCYLFIERTSTSCSSHKVEVRLI